MNKLLFATHPCYIGKVTNFDVAKLFLDSSYQTLTVVHKCALEHCSVGQ